MQDDIVAELLAEYLDEAAERIARIEEGLLSLPERTDRAEALIDARRELHTLKGNSGMMGFSELQSLAHRLEDRLDGDDVGEAEIADVLAGLDRFRDGLARVAHGESELVGDDLTGSERDGAVRAGSEGSVRVPAATVDGLVDRMAELITLRNRLTGAIAHGRAAGGALGPTAADAGRRLSLSSERDDPWEAVERCAEELEAALELLREDLMRLRMVPLRPVFRSLKRLVHDETERAGKQVELQLRGEDTPLDRSLTDLASEVLGHLVRNAVSHGISPPEQRMAAGKPTTGTVLVEAEIAGSRVVIQVLDDGAGIDGEALAEAAALAGIEDVDTSDLHAPGLPPRSLLAPGDRPERRPRGSGCRRFSRRSTGSAERSI